MGDNYCLEIDNNFFTLSGSALDLLDELQSSKNSKVFVSDFDQSISKIMKVESQIKYAEVMVAKKLQSEGEFDEPVTVISHWKKKTGGNSTTIFFTAMPSKTYLQYLDTINEHNNLLSIVPVFSILTNLINKIAKKETVAVVFRHGRFADLVIGKNSDFYFASRCVAFDTDDEQIESLWETVFREISMTMEDQAIQINKIVSLNWIDSLEEIPLAKSLKIEQTVFNREHVTHNKTVYDISFTKAMKLFPPMDGVVPDYGNFFYWSDKISPMFIIFLLTMIIIQVSGFFYYQSKTKTLAPDIPAIEKRISHLQTTISSIPEKKDYTRTVRFVDDLLHNKELPSYKEIINDISMGIFPFTTIEQLQINFIDRILNIRLSGVMNTDFDSAYKGYQLFLSNLEQRGYNIDTQNFTTKIDVSRFELELSRGIL